MISARSSDILIESWETSGFLFAPFSYFSQWRCSLSSNKNYLCGSITRIFFRYGTTEYHKRAYQPGKCRASHPAAWRNTFAQKGLIYESRELSIDQTKVYHNAVFVGFDERGVARHAHKRGLYTQGKSYRGNIVTTGLSIWKHLTQQ